MSFARRIAIAGLALFVALLAPAQAASTPDREAMAAAMQLFYRGDWDGSMAAFEQILEGEPENALALAYVLHASYKKKEIDLVINRYEQRAVARGEDPLTQAQLGMAYFLRGMIIPNVLDEALTEFRQSMKDDDSLSLPHTGMGLVYFQKRMMPRAKGYFIRALRINPHDVLAMDRLGNILLVDDKLPEDALQLFRRIVAELPTYPDGHYFMGSALYDLGRHEEALGYLQKAAELDPNGYTQGYEAMTLLGDTLLKLRRYADAVDAYQRAQKIHPDSKYLQIKIEQAQNPEEPTT